MRAAQDFTWIVCAGTVLGLLITLLGVCFLDPLIWWLGASRLLFSYCREYLLIILLFTPAGILQVLFQNFIITAGRPGFGMVLSVSAGAANLLLDYLFMVPFRMGIRGAALGTGIGYLIPALAGLFFFAGNRGTLKFCMPKPEVPVLAECCLNGFSELVSQMAAAVTTFCFNRVMMSLSGENGVAAVTIMIYTEFLLNTLYIGFSMGVAPIISYRYGQGGRACLKRILKQCIFFILVVSVVVFALSMVFGTPLAGIFALPGTPVHDIARRGFRIFPFGFLFCGINIFASAFFTALSDGRVSAVISLLRSLLLLLFFLFTLPLLWQEAGVWLAVPMAELVTMLVSAVFLWKSMG